MGSSSSITIGYRYYTNVHLALGQEGVETIYEIRIGDRPAWLGELTGAGTMYIMQEGLFGGEKREGGAAGMVDFMPGGQSQPTNPSLWSAILSSTGSLNTPAYRGISSLFFKGLAGVSVAGTPWDTYNSGDLTPSKDVAQSGLVDDVVQLTMTALTDELDSSDTSTITGNPAQDDPGPNTAFYWSAMNPYFKKVAVRCSRVFRDWYPEKAQINRGVNPAHIVYECLTNEKWGLGYSTLEIDDTSFRAAADTLHNEGYNMAFKWNAQTSVQDFINMVNEHVNSTVIEDRVTGLWRMNLVRDNLILDNLIEFDESNSRLINFQRKALGDTVNEIVASYTLIENGETDTVTAQDLANFTITGKVNSQTRDYTGFNDPELARRAAQRDLMTLSRPLAKVTLEVNRQALNLYPGDGFKLSWATLGLNGVVFRVASMDLGGLLENKILIEAVEDSFKTPVNSYIAKEPIGWVDGAGYAEPVTDYKFFSLSYYELFTALQSQLQEDWLGLPAYQTNSSTTQIFNHDYIGVEPNYIALAAAKPTLDSRSLELYDVSSGKYVGNGEFTPYVTLSGNVAQEVTTVAVVSYTDYDTLTDILRSRVCWLNDEIIEVVSFNNATGEITFNRGMLDTVPKVHLSGSKIWGYSNGQNLISEQILFSAPDTDPITDSYKIVPSATLGKLKPSQLASIPVSVVNRANRPYPPGNVRIDGQYYPPNISKTFTLTWAHRDRTQQLAGLVRFTDGDVGPEMRGRHGQPLSSPDDSRDHGVFYAVVLKDEQGTDITHLGSFESNDIGVTPVPNGYINNTTPSVIIANNVTVTLSEFTPAVVIVELFSYLIVSDARGELYYDPVNMVWKRDPVAPLQDPSDSYEIESWQRHQITVYRDDIWIDSNLWDDDATWNDGT